MKKFALSMMIALVVTLSANICAAYYYDNDPDYVFVTSLAASGGWYTYLYLPSVDVQEYNPPHYQIAGRFVMYNKYSDETNELYIIKRFNWHTKETFTKSPYTKGQFIRDNVKGNSNPEISSRQFADALFRAAYGMDFYGY